MKTKVLALTSLSLLATACGSQQFDSIATTQMSQAPGTLQIAPKIDVILVEDDTGRIQESYSQISQQAQNFLNTLDQQGWNYHFATIRLTTSGPVTEAVASKQDPNWGSSLWQAPYPGATITNVPSLSSSVFTTINSTAGFTPYAGFLQPGQATNVLMGKEPGFTTILQEAQTGFNNTGFLRSDALLAFVLIGTGNDTSYVNYCRRADGMIVPCESVTSTLCSSLTQASPTGYPAAAASSPSCGSDALSLNYFVSQFQALKPSTQQIKFFSAVASLNSSTSGGQLCAGGYATPGTRYQRLASALNGQSYDVCSQSLSTILPDIAQNLTTTALNFEKNFLVLQQQPDPSTIQVVKYLGGDPNNSVTIPKDSTNGWTYAGWKDNQPVIDAPIAMNYESGYMIELHGTAKLSGADNASITYKTPTGTSINQGQ